MATEIEYSHKDISVIRDYQEFLRDVYKGTPRPAIYERKSKP